MSDFKYDKLPEDLSEILDERTVRNLVRNHTYSLDDLTILFNRVTGSIPADLNKGDTYIFYSRGILPDGSAIIDVVDDLTHTTNAIRDSDIGFLLIDDTFNKSLTRTIEQELSASLKIPVNEFTLEQIAQVKNRVNLLLNGTDEFGNRVN